MPGKKTVFRCPPEPGSLRRGPDQGRIHDFRRFRGVLPQFRPGIPFSGHGSAGPGPAGTHFDADFGGLAGSGRPFSLTLKQQPLPALENKPNPVWVRSKDRQRHRPPETGGTPGLDTVKAPLPEVVGRRFHRRVLPVSLPDEYYPIAPKQKSPVSGPTFDPVGMPTGSKVGRMPTRTTSRWRRLAGG